MLQKNIDKENRKNRATWEGYHTRKTPTKREKLDKIEKKHKSFQKVCAFLFIRSITKFSVKVVFTDMTSEYDSLNSMIYINLDEGGEEFLYHIIKQHGFEDARKYSNSFWTVLHELGHYFTENTIEDFPEMPEKTYFDDECEFLATEWAINFILSHKIFSQIFSKII